MSNRVNTDETHITDIEQANTLFQNIKESTDRINKIVTQDSSTNGVRVGRYSNDDRRSKPSIAENSVFYAVLFITVVSLIFSIFQQIEIIGIHDDVKKLSNAVSTISEQQSLAIPQPSQSSVK